MTSRISIAISALAVGTALAAVPSFAQTYDQSKRPAAQQPAAQEQSRDCIHFAQGCSDKPYPMAQNTSSNSEQKSAQTGTRENRETRSASSRERTSGARVRVGERERLSGSARVSERERASGGARVSERARVSGGARVSERTRTSDEYVRSAAPEPSGARVRVAGREGVRGETYGFGERRDYYNAAPGVEVAGTPSSAIAWCETRFHSFDPATGTYLGFDGIRHPCP